MDIAFADSKQDVFKLGMFQQTDFAHGPSGNPPRAANPETVMHRPLYILIHRQKSLNRSAAFL